MNGRTFGPRVHRDGVTLRLWAPGAREVAALLESARPMQRGGNGWFTHDIPGAPAGMRYRFRIDGELDVPDPASMFQPADVEGPSEVIDHSAFEWRAADWRGRPWREAVLLECHVGTFTPAGTYRGMIERLDHLVDTGITALELLPIADFPGSRNWGYDGVLWYAPDHVYGSPDDLKTLIDEAHLRGLMVFLDVVYNHFGPEGNYLGRYAPGFFSNKQTPWGSVIDYSRAEVRTFAVENALHWVGNYRFDGLRLDAVHAFAEPGGFELLDELSRTVGEFARENGRLIHLVLENDDNRASLLDPSTAIPSGKYRAQWNDDYHHAWHVLLTGETHGYYTDYAGEPQRAIARALRAGFVYQGEPSAHRGGRRRGEPSSRLPPTAFVNFLQNHDQIGNRALGDRLEWSADSAALEAALAVTLLAPMPPMLFMGDEFGARTPFPFFCDFRGALADAIREGRRREFAQAYESFGHDVPDPLSPATFKSAVLNWRDLDGAGRSRHALIKRLLDIRRTAIAPHLDGARFRDSDLHAGNRQLTASWQLGDAKSLALLANLSDQSLPRGLPLPRGTQLWGGEPPATLPPWSVFWTTGAP
jgi:maltooligosyltrehalose trehalohydrolase